ncbi:MAG: outer membrane beta-barrel protein [Chryseolinea sp.]
MIQRIQLLIFCLVVVVAAHGQEKKKRIPNAYHKKKQEKKDDEKFLEKQWWLGFKAGANLSNIRVDKTYSVVSPTNYDASSIAKKGYNNFDLWGSQATIEISFYFKRFLLSFQPTYQHIQFQYSNKFEWNGSTEQATNHVELSYKQLQKVDYAIFPLIVKYDVYGHRLRPYVQAGIYSAMRLSANKEVSASGIDNAAGGNNQFHTETVSVGAGDLFAKYHWGVMGGVGVNYNLGNHVRLNLDVMYKYGMSNITSTEHRYSSDRLAGVGDAMDDMKLDNLFISLGCLFPLRFLQSTLQTLDK